MQVEVNLLAVLLAGVASMAVGFFWYSPTLFGNQWLKLMGISKSDVKKSQKQMGPMYALSFVATLVTAYVLTHFLQYAAYATNTERMTAGLMSGFWAWAGFVAPVQMTDVIFGGKKWMLFAINTGYQLVSLLVAGAVLGYLG